MLEQLELGQTVSYRYMSFPPGVILGINKHTQRVLLTVDFCSEKFTKWVHVTSISQTVLRQGKDKGVHPHALLIG